MSLPQQFGTRGRISPTRASPTGKAIPELTIDEDNSTVLSLTNRENMLDGDIDTSGTFIVNNGDTKELIIDMGSWYALNGLVASWKVSVGAGDTVMDIAVSPDRTTWFLVSGATAPNTGEIQTTNESTSQKHHRWIRFNLQAGTGGNNTATIFLILPMV